MAINLQYICRETLWWSHYSCFSTSCEQSRYNDLCYSSEEYMLIRLDRTVSA